MKSTLQFNSNQRFSCRDCPARCCRLPVAISLNQDEIKRYIKQDWVRSRVGEKGIRLIENGIVPTREAAGILQCIFLDDDELCSMQKQFDHGFLPQTCQSFPFGFVSDERGQLITQLSFVCPSVRDGYGELLTLSRVKQKLSEKGGSERMSKAMATRHGKILSQTQYMKIVARWQEATARVLHEGTIMLLLSQLYDWTKAFEDALTTPEEKPTDTEVAQAIDAADRIAVKGFDLRTTSSFQVRMLHSYILGGLSYPARVVFKHRLDKPSAWQKLMALWTKAKWLVGRGTVDLLYVSNPVNLSNVNHVARFIGTDTAKPIIKLLNTVLERRQIFRDPRHLMEILIDMALATVTISHYARCRAASENRTSVNDIDVQEGISIAELALLGHAAQRHAGKFMKQTRRTLIGARANFLSLLASENDGNT